MFCGSQNVLGPNVPKEVLLNRGAVEVMKYCFAGKLQKKHLQREELVGQ